MCIDPRSLWQTAFVYSLFSRMRYELLNTEMFCRLKEAQLLAEDWRMRYNRVHPHGGQGMQSPGALAGSRLIFCGRSPSWLRLRFRKPVS